MHVHITVRKFVIFLVILVLLLSPMVFVKDDATVPVQPRPISKPQPSTQSMEDAQVRLDKYLNVEASLLGVSDSVSYFYKGLQNNIEVSSDPTRSWIPASTIKSYVALEAFRQRRAGIISFDQIVTVPAQDVVPTELETDEFPRLREGTQVTIGELVQAMVTQSDNTAYNVLLDVLDRRNINATLRNYGITETIVGEKLNLDDNQFQKDLLVPGRQPNTTTVKDLATFFDLLYSNKIPDAQEMLAIFKRQKLNYMIPAFLPKDTTIAHKTGDLAPIYHDGGIVYKPNDQFILVVFTDDNDPSVISKLAQVAYYQNVTAIGKDGPLEPPPSNQPQFQPLHSQIYLTQAQASNSRVLGVETIAKFPSITTADLGITAQDVTPGPQEAKKVSAAWITNGSLLFPLKRYMDRVQLLLSVTPRLQVETRLAMARERLSEAKTLIQQGKTANLDATLRESENNLKKATTLAQTIKNSDDLLLQAKAITDLHYATIGDQIGNLNAAEKNDVIDSMYAFHQRNDQEVKPIIQKAVVNNPNQEQPIVGTVTKVVGETATVKLENGVEKQVVITAATNERDFHEKNFVNTAQVVAGTKIAVIGQSDKSGRIVSRFILNDVPSELPKEHQGVVVQIDTDKNELIIKDNSGKDKVIKVDSDTIIKSKDTDVSLEGIKAGSQVTVFGEPQGTSAIPAIPSSSNGEGQIQQGSAGPSQSQQSAPEIKATSVTVTKNSSGSNEKVNTPAPQPQKEEKKSSPPPPQKAEPPKPADASKGKK